WSRLFPEVGALAACASSSSVPRGCAHAARAPAPGHSLDHPRRLCILAPEPLSTSRYIVVEGPIAVGKTSLARRLAERLDSALLLERPELNPFLPRFYHDMDRYALPTQLFFLFQRVQQLRELAQLDLFNRVTVSDFLLEKDPLFASLTLTGEELHLYQRIYDALKPQAPRPDLVIYLQAQPATLYERVRRRGTDFERPI